MGRNSAPAILAAALLVAETDPDAVLWMMAADHAVQDLPALHAALAVAANAARDGRIVTFGMQPTAPETGYGYIEVGEALADIPGAHVVNKFVEKPNAATAAAFLAGGRHMWNSGMFVFTAATLIAEIARHAPDLLDAVRPAVAGRIDDLDFSRLDPVAFAACPSISIDYAVAERTDRAVVVPTSVGWTDVGSWSALWDLGAKDTGGNVALGDVLLEDATDCYVRTDGTLTAVVGLQDVVLVVTGDAVLAIQGDRFQVKRIVVKPGAQLSLQKHFHRAEHWVVVEGTGVVTRNAEQIAVHENESVYLPLGCVHRLENPGRIPLTLIEVQSGSYLGEDDIVRLEDTYGRS